MCIRDRLKETYNFKADISAHSRIDQVGTPEGSLEILVSYCGDDNFPQEAVADIEHQCPDPWQQGIERQVRIGYVGCTYHDGTTPAELMALHKTRGMLPIDIPIGGKEISTADSLRNGCRACLLRQEYTPVLPNQDVYKRQERSLTGRPKWHRILGE